MYCINMREFSVLMFYRCFTCIFKKIVVLLIIFYINVPNPGAQQVFTEAAVKVRCV